MMVNIELHSIDDARVLLHTVQKFDVGSPALSDSIAKAVEEAESKLHDVTCLQESMTPSASGILDFHEAQKS